MKLRDRAHISNLYLRKRVNEYFQRTQFSDPKNCISDFFLIKSFKNKYIFEFIFFLALYNINILQRYSTNKWYQDRF